jgi:hypothetical protein
MHPKQLTVSNPALSGYSAVAASDRSTQVVGGLRLASVLSVLEGSSTPRVLVGTGFAASGVAAPAGILHCLGDATYEATIVVQQVNNQADGPNLDFRKAKGTLAVPQTLSANDMTGVVTGNAWNASTSMWVQTHEIGMVHNNIGASSLEFKTLLSSTLATRLSISSTGTVTIGAANSFQLPTEKNTGAPTGKTLASLTTTGTSASASWTSLAESCALNAAGEIPWSTSRQPTQLMVHLNTDGGNVTLPPTLTKICPGTIFTIKNMDPIKDVAIYRPTGESTKLIHSGAGHATYGQYIQLAPYASATLSLYTDNLAYATWYVVGVSGSVTGVSASS